MIGGDDRRDQISAIPLAGDGKGQPSELAGNMHIDGDSDGNGFGVGANVGLDNACGMANGPDDPDFIRSAHEDFRRTVVDTVAFRHIFQVV